MTIILSGNCYWCTEALYQQIKRCTVVPGHFHFAGGRVEAVRVDGMALTDVLDVFFVSHNPSLVDWDNCEYPLNRSAIILTHESQRATAQEKIEEAKLIFGTVHTKILNAEDGRFVALAEKDQNFYLKNPQDGYCTSIIEPRLAKLRQKLSSLLA